MKPLLTFCFNGKGKVIIILHDDILTGKGVLCMFVLPWSCICSAILGSTWIIIHHHLHL